MGRLIRPKGTDSNILFAFVAVAVSALSAVTVVGMAGLVSWGVAISVLYGAVNLLTDGMLVGLV